MSTPIETVKSWPREQLVVIVCLLLLSGCHFPGVDQHEGHNYQPNPWHVPTNNPSL